MRSLFGIVASSIYFTLSKCENVAQSLDDVSTPIHVHTQRLAVDDTSNWISVASLFDTTLCTTPTISIANDEDKVCIHSHWYLDDEPYDHLTLTYNDEAYNFWNDTQWTTINTITSVDFEESVSESILTSLSTNNTPSRPSRRRLRKGKCGWRCQDERRDRKERARWKRQNAIKDRMSKLQDREMHRRDEADLKRRDKMQDAIGDPLANLVKIPRKKLNFDELVAEREKWRRYYLRKIRKLHRRYERRRARAYRERKREWLEHNDHYMMRLWDELNRFGNREN